jgi:hypothetical protein
MRIAYADPPYPGCAHRYVENMEVNHARLIAKLDLDYDGFILHTSSTALREIIKMCPNTVRIMAWVKPFAAFKRNVSVAYAWEPIIVKACRKPMVTHRIIMRDWVSSSITLKKGLVGAKPEAVIRWAIEMVGAQPCDELDDLFPGTGIISEIWNEWRREVLRSAI